MTFDNSWLGAEISGLLEMEMPRLIDSASLHHQRQVWVGVEPDIRSYACEY